MQLKPKNTVENREKLRSRFSGKNRGFGFGSVPVTALLLTNMLRLLSTNYVLIQLHRGMILTLT